MFHFSDCHESIIMVTKKAGNEKPKGSPPDPDAVKKVQTKLVALKIDTSAKVAPMASPHKHEPKVSSKKQVSKVIPKNQVSAVNAENKSPISDQLPDPVEIVNDQKAVAADENEEVDWKAEGIDEKKDISKKYYTKNKTTQETTELIIKLGYQLEDQIGKGGFGIVKRAIQLKTNQEVAIKIIDVKLKEEENMDEELRLKRRQRRLDDLRHELFTLEKVKHENIIELIEHFMIDDILYIAMEYADGGTIGDLLKAGRRPLSEGKAKRWFLQCCRAVHYMHQRGFSHRDIKLANILLKKPPPGAESHRICKVTDFGLSRVSWTDSRGPTMCLSYVGTVPYMAPEILEVDIAHEKIKDVTPYNPMIADIWALGVCLYGMLTRSFPFNSDPKTNSKAALVQMMKDQSYKFPSRVRKKISAEVKDLIRNMLTYDVDSRITFAGILTHPWIYSYVQKKSRKSRTNTTTTRKVTQTTENRNMTVQTKNTTLQAGSPTRYSKKSS